MNHDNIDDLIEIVPQQYGEAVLLYPWLEFYPGHEWDNRTTIENATYLIRHLTNALHSDGVSGCDWCSYYHARKMYCRKCGKT